MEYVDGDGLLSAIPRAEYETTEGLVSFAFVCSHAPTTTKTVELSRKMKKERGVASEARIQGASIKVWYLTVGDILPGGPELNCSESGAHMLAFKRDAEANAIA